MNEEILKELRFGMGERREKPSDDNIFGVQQYLLQTLAPYGIFVVGFKRSEEGPQKEGSLDFLLEKEGVQFILRWWGGSQIQILSI